MWRLRSDSDRVGRRLGDDGICPIVADDACFQRRFISCLKGVPKPTEKHRFRRRRLPNRSAQYCPVRLQCVPKSVPTFLVFTRQTVVVRFEIVETPWKIPLIVGDFAYCLRSSLDHLGGVATVTRVTEHGPAALHAFPFTRKMTRSVFEGLRNQCRERRLR